MKVDHEEDKDVNTVILMLISAEWHLTPPTTEEQLKTITNNNNNCNHKNSNKNN